MAEKGVEEQVLAMERLHYNSIKSRNFNVRWNLPLHWNLKFQVSLFPIVLNHRGCGSNY